MPVAATPDRRISLTDQFRQVNGANLAPSVEIPMVSAAVSANGQSTEINFPQGSFVFSDNDLAQFFAQDADQQQHDLNALAEKANFADLLSHTSEDLKHLHAEIGTQAMMNETLGKMAHLGASAISFNEHDRSDRPFINTGAQTSGAENIASLMNLQDASYIKAPAAYIDAYNSYIIAHEIEHTHNSSHHMHGDTVQNLMINEIVADHGSLRSHFNRDYHQFVMDVRAVASLQATSGGETHATHIWSEEYEEGRMPTQTEAEQLAAAPREIQERALSLSASGMDRFNLRQEFKDDPASRHAHYKVLHEQGAFNDIPFGNEFVEKYLEGAERILDADKLQAYDIAALREQLAPNDTMMAEQRQTITAPTMGGM